MSNNLVIGINNKLPWKLKKDLQHFSSYTKDKTIIMGRKTYESIGHALPNRKNIVISSNLRSSEHIQVATNLDEAILFACNWNIEHNQQNEAILIGGGHIFRESLELVNKLVLTRVDCEIKGDVFYPEIDFEAWKQVNQKSFKKDEENQFDFVIETYLKV
jgi:dihydrofolate reductase